MNRSLPEKAKVPRYLDKALCEANQRFADPATPSWLK
jgi:hypothetical protein